MSRVKYLVLVAVLVFAAAFAASAQNDNGNTNSNDNTTVDNTNANTNGNDNTVAVSTNGFLVTIEGETDDDADWLMFRNMGGPTPHGGQLVNIYDLTEFDIWTIEFESPEDFPCEQLVVYKLSGEGVLDLWSDNTTCEGGILTINAGGTGEYFVYLFPSVAAGQNPARTLGACVALLANANANTNDNTSSLNDGVTTCRFGSLPSVGVGVNANANDNTAAAAGNTNDNTAGDNGNDNS